MAGPPAGWARVYRVVERVPRGRVTTYGAVAELAGMPRAARQVGYALAALKGSDHRLPWHRVLASRPHGRATISIRDPLGGAIQRQLLEAEGVELDLFGRVDLARFGWSARPRRSAPRPAARARPRQ